MRKSIWLVCLVLFLTGCSQPSPEMTFFNMTDQPVTVVCLEDAAATAEIPSKEALRDHPVRPGARYEVRSAGGVVESFQVGEPPVVFGSEDRRLLYVVGGPADLVLADYTEFYTEPGQQSTPKAAIRDVVNMRDRKTQPISAGVQLLFPSDDMPQTVSGDGRIVRVVYVARALIPDDKIEAYLDYELKRRIREAKE